MQPFNEMFADGVEVQEQKEIYLSRREIVSFEGVSLVVRKLYLHNNRLASFSLAGEDFPNMVILNLSGNYLTSFSIKGVFSNLKELDLGGNLLTSFSAEGVFPNLEDLYLDQNQLTSFSFGVFPNLKSLELSRNRLVSFSAKGNFQTLEYLNLYDNQLASFSSIFGDFLKLKELNLSRNRLTSFSAGGSFPNLEKFDISYNPDLDNLEISAPKLTIIWIGNTKILFLDDSLIKKIIDREDVQAHEHSRGTKELVPQAFHQGNPIVDEIVVHLTR